MKNVKSSDAKTFTQSQPEKKLDIPQDKLAEYKTAFDVFDADKCGKISVDDIFQVLKSIGHELTRDEIKQFLSNFKSETPNLITFDEFISFFQMTAEAVQEADDVIKAFQAFDKDNNGTLTADEFRHILTNLGNNFTNEEVDELFKEADLDKDGLITYKEFVEFWKAK